MENKQKLHFRPIGRGFIVHAPVQGGPAGRSLAMAYSDQYNKKYVDIDGSMRPLEKKHGFLAAD